MNKVETLEEFYKKKFDWMPDTIRNEIGHFNIFKLEPLIGGKSQPIPYMRRDYYKIMLVMGNSKVHYADKVVEVKKRHYHFQIHIYLINGNTLIIFVRVVIVFLIITFFISMAILPNNRCGIYQRIRKGIHLAAKKQRKGF